MAEPHYEAETECAEPFPLVFFGDLKRSDDGEDSNSLPVTEDVQEDVEYRLLFGSDQDDNEEQKNDEDDCSTVYSSV